MTLIGFGCLQLIRQVETCRATAMNLRKRASKFFRSNGTPSSSVVPPMPHAQHARGPPPMAVMPAINELRIPASAPPKIQKAPKPPVQVALITNEMIRELRELIRYRYALDCKIWYDFPDTKWVHRLGKRISDIFSRYRLAVLASLLRL